MIAAGVEAGELLWITWDAGAGGAGRQGEVRVGGGLAGSLERDLNPNLQREEAAGLALTAGPSPALARYSHPGVYKKQVSLLFG